MTITIPVELVWFVAGVICTLAVILFWGYLIDRRQRQQPIAAPAQKPVDPEMVAAYAKILADSKDAL